MFCPQPLHHLPSLGICAHCCTQAALLCGQKPCPSWLAAGLLLNAGSALAKGGQVMLCPRPLHQLPELPSHIFSECAAWPREAKQTDRPFKILGRRRSCQAAGPSALHCLPSTAPPGSFFSNIYWWPGAHGIVDSAPGFPSNHVVPVWFNVVPTMPKRASCSHQRNPSRLAVDPCWMLAAP